MFRPVPDAGRAACLDPNAPRKPAKPGTSASSIVLRNIQFQDVDVDLAFDAWELELARTNANGSLSAGGEGPPLLFEARDVVAAKGALRLGRRGNAWTARIPFDAVEITRVGVTAELPTDLELQVASARTGRARLSGQAAFRNIFPPRIGQAPPGEPGLDVDARWAGFGAALGGLDASWRPQGAWAAHLDGDLHAMVKGPFRSMAGTLEIEGGGTRMYARVAHSAADLWLTFAGVETGWMLDPALRPLLGGLLHGSFHATAHLWPTFAGIDAEIPHADLRLDRRRAPSGPRRFELRIGKESRAGGATDTLYASIESVRLADAVLRLSGLRADWTGLSARLDARVAFSPPGSVAAAPPGHRPRSEVEAHGQLAVAALEDWIPGGAVSGPLHLAAAVEGTLERIVLGLAFAPPTAIGVYGQRFLLPRKLDAVYAAEVGVTVPKVVLRRVGGGTIELGGRLGAGGKVAASLGVRDYPVNAIPGLDRQQKLGALGGTLHADLALGGPLERPSLHGRLGVAALALDRRPIGNLETNLRLGTEGGDLDATIDPGITLRARVRRRPALSFEATVAVRDRALGPWLPAPLTGAAIAATGDVKVGYRAAGLTGEGLLRLAGPGLEGVQIDGQVHGLDARARVQGQIDVSRWPQLWSRALKSAAGRPGGRSDGGPGAAPQAGAAALRGQRPRGARAHLARAALAGADLGPRGRADRPRRRGAHGERAVGRHAGSARRRRGSRHARHRRPRADAAGAHARRGARRLPLSGPPPRRGRGQRGRLGRRPDRRDAGGRARAHARRRRPAREPDRPARRRHAGRAGQRPGRGARRPPPHRRAARRHRGRRRRHRSAPPARRPPPRSPRCPRSGWGGSTSRSAART